MKIVDCVQLSPLWWESRQGLPTASNANRIITPLGKPSAQMDGYIAELIGDMLALDPNAMTEKPMNAAMRHGVECEPRARAWYAMEKNVEVKQVGICISDDGRIACSPDGIVADAYGLELKCVQASTQVKYLLEGGLPSEYRPQVHFSMLVTGFKSWEFLSYCDGLKPLLVTVHEDNYTKELRVQTEVFYAKFQAALAKIRAM